MSGRLIILRHKSWHVWNQDNIEKVKKDERLAAEEEEKNKEKQRLVDQEIRLDELKYRATHDRRHDDKAAASTKARGKKKKGNHKDDKRRGPEDELAGGLGAGWEGASGGHVNFFAAEEREARKVLGVNADHEADEKERELQALRRKNMAPWALGDGSAEAKGEGLKPWYHYSTASADAGHVGSGGKISGGALAEPATRRMRVRGRDLVGGAAEAAWGRDERRKVSEDPMSALVSSNPPKPLLPSPPASGTPADENRGDKSLVEYIGETDDKIKNKKKKKKKCEKSSSSKKKNRNSKKKKKSRHKHSRRKGSSRSSSSGGGGSSNEDGPAAAAAAGDGKLAALRAARLA
ncbi:unnamed protein product, partial [Heterosigma akashiwo]